MTTRLTIIFSFALVALCLTNCQNKEAVEEQKRLEEQKAKLVELQKKTVIPSAEFVAFVNGFDSGLQSVAFNTEWLEGFANSGNIKEISPKVCEDFIYGHSVWNHNLNDKSNAEKKILSKTKLYYYVGQISTPSKYTALVFTDLEEDATETYLCTYTKDGKFVSGIVLQADYSTEEIENVRDGSISESHQMNLKIEEQVGTSEKDLEFTISPEGEIHPIQRNS